ncbi:MAG: phosphotransferase, partial [Propionibacteriaceae bacterium]
NDFAPYNLVFRDGHLVGVIDFDTASPGPRIWDLAYLAYRLVPFAEDALADSPGPVKRAMRLERLIEAYGHSFAPEEVLAVAAARLADLARFTDARAADTGRTDFVEHAAMYRRDQARLLELSRSARGR